MPEIANTDDEEALTELEARKAQKARIEEEVKRRRRAALKAQKDAEDEQLIAAGRGTRGAKQKALQDAPWFEAQGKKRPRSPAGNDTAANNGGGAKQPKQVASKEKRQRTSQRIEDDDGGGKETRKKARSQAVKVNNKDVRAAAVIKKKAGVIASDSDSEAPSEPESEEDIGKFPDDDSAEDEVNDDGLDMSGMGEKEIRKVLHEEMPHDPSRLFDIDDNVEMASVRSSRSRASSSEVSRPPTSESEGPLWGEINASEDEGESGVDEIPSQKKKSSAATKPMTKRDAALAQERPSMISSRAVSTSKSHLSSERKSTVRIESDKEDDAPQQDLWPAHTQLNLAGKLRAQNVFIRKVCHDAINIVEKTLVTEDAWPELHKAALYRRQVLAAAAGQLLGKDKRYKDLLMRINKDDDFTKIIGKWVVDRLSHYRGTIREAAGAHIALFQLGVGDGCKARVKALQDNDVYVYPGEWGTTEKGEPIWITKRSQSEVYVYLNPALIDLIRDAFFSNPMAFGYKFKEHYVSSLLEYWRAVRAGAMP